MPSRIRKDAVSAVQLQGDTTVIVGSSVTVSSSALPSGASTSALQTTGNTSLTAMALSLLSLEIYTDGIETLLNSIDTRLTDFKTRSDTFTVAANGVTVDCSANPLKSFTLQVKGTGAAPTSWTVILEGSLDNVNFDTILTHTDTGTADGKIIFLGTTNCAVLYFRSRCSAVVLGGATNIVARILGTK